MKATGTVCAWELMWSNEVRGKEPKRRREKWHKVNVRCCWEMTSPSELQIKRLGHTVLFTSETGVILETTCRRCYPKRMFLCYDFQAKLFLQQSGCPNWRLVEPGPVACVEDSLEKPMGVTWSSGGSSFPMCPALCPPPKNSHFSCLYGGFCI